MAVLGFFMFAYEFRINYVICIVKEQQVFETDAKCDIVYDACCNDTDFDTNYEAYYVICIVKEQQVFETDAKCDIVYDACCNDTDFDTNYEAYLQRPDAAVVNLFFSEFNEEVEQKMYTALVIGLLCLHGYFLVTHGMRIKILGEGKEADDFGGNNRTDDFNSAETSIDDLEQNFRTDNISFTGLRKAFSYMKGAALIGNKIFVTRGDIAYWFNAKRTCMSHGGELAMPRTPEENAAVLSIQKQFDKTSFLGFSNRQSDSQFKDVFGIGITYTNWQKGQPDNYQGMEQCAQMTTSGEWNDVNCAARLLVVCEYDGVLPPQNHMYRNY
ncbi:uncharacterized protein PAF06_019444 [Gastrophryne carolinensis]